MRRDTYICDSCGREMVTSTLNYEVTTDAGTKVVILATRVRQHTQADASSAPALSTAFSAEREDLCPICMVRLMMQHIPEDEMHHVLSAGLAQLPRDFKRWVKDPLDMRIPKYAVKTTAKILLQLKRKRSIL